MIQFLAGAPELLARYRNAPPAAGALINAAMDARRLGMGAGLPQAFLEAAAPGYLTDAEWDGLGENWLEQALAYTAVPCKGARGPLTRIRPRRARRAARDREDQPGSMAAAAGPLYRLADYLDQHGRAHRASQIPPAEFWSAAAAHAAPGDQAALGDAAHARGLYRDAAQLHKNALHPVTPAPSTTSAIPLPACAPIPARRTGPPPTPPSTTRAQWLTCWTACGGRRARAGHRAAGPNPPPTPPSTTQKVWLSCWTACGRRTRTTGRRTGRPGRRPGTPRRPPRRRSPAGLPAGAGAHEQAAALADQAADRASLDDPRAVARLLEYLRKAGAHEQATALARRAADGPPLDDPDSVAYLLGSLRKAGAHEQAAALVR